MIISIAYDVTDTQTAMSVTAAIKQLGTRWARPLASVWYVDTDHSTAEIETRLGALLDIDDGLIVQDASGPTSLANTAMRWTPVATNASSHPVSCKVIKWPGHRNKLPAAA